jgi:hypothetical protein
MEPEKQFFNAPLQYTKTRRLAMTRQQSIVMKSKICMVTMLKDTTRKHCQSLA